MNPLAAGIALVLLGVAALVLAARTSSIPARRNGRRRPDAAIVAETTLLRQLTSAEISRREYRQEIEKLAARTAP